MRFWYSFLNADHYFKGVFWESSQWLRGDIFGSIGKGDSLSAQTGALATTV